MKLMIQTRLINILVLQCGNAIMDENPTTLEIINSFSLSIHLSSDAIQESKR